MIHNAIKANDHRTLPQAIATAGRLADFDMAWIEEPISFDDVQGHRRLAKAMRTSIALGDMAHVHWRLCCAHPASSLLEYIPWLRGWLGTSLRLQTVTIQHPVYWAQ